MLSVDYLVSNTGAQHAYSVNVTNSYGSNGVTTDNMPIALGNVTASMVRVLTIRYSIPVGVMSFTAHVETSVQDGSRVTYNYWEQILGCGSPGN